MSDREGLQQELTKVLQELRRREVVLADLEQRITKVKFELEGNDSQRAVLAGDARIVVQSEARRRVFREQLTRMSKERERAAQEVRQAEDRRKEIERELSE